MSQFENVKHEKLIVYKFFKTTSPNDCFWILLKEKVDPKQVPTKTYTCVYVTNCLKKKMTEILEIFQKLHLLLFCNYV